VTGPLVSVILPVYCPRGQGLDELAECLGRLSGQTWPRDQTELIVIDNGCPGIERVLAPHPHVRLVREEQPGSYAARNAGLRIARGEVLAFTDADCLPEPGWLACGAAGVADGQPTSVVTGPIRLVTPRPPGVSPTAYLYSAALSFVPKGAHPTGGFGATANLIVRRATMDAVGPFDASFKSGGDWDWGRRAAELGFRTRFDPELCVGHQARPTVGSILRRELRLAGGNQMHQNRRGPASRVRRVRDLLYSELRGDLRWAMHQLRKASHSEPVSTRLSAAALVVAVQTLRTAERLRVMLGGAARRA
jgi:glycosyltransferase involved in cell wall biosynthesis